MTGNAPNACGRSLLLRAIGAGEGGAVNVVWHGQQLKGEAAGHSQQASLSSLSASATRTAAVPLLEAPISPAAPACSSLSSSATLSSGDGSLVDGSPVIGVKGGYGGRGGGGGGGTASPHVVGFLRVIDAVGSLGFHTLHARHACKSSHHMPGAPSGKPFMHDSWLVHPPFLVFATTICADTRRSAGKSRGGRGMEFRVLGGRAVLRRGAFGHTEGGGVWVRGAHSPLAAYIVWVWGVRCVLST